MKRQYTQEPQSVHALTKRANSLVKLPKLNFRQKSPSNLNPNGSKRSTFSPSDSARKNEWRQKIITARKLAPLSNLVKDQKTTKTQPRASCNQTTKIVIQNNLLAQGLRQSQIQDRILSSKLYGSKTIQINLKKSISSRNMNLASQEQQQVKLINFENEQKIKTVKYNFQLLLPQDTFKLIQFPNFDSINVQKFFPIWQMVDTILFNYKKLGNKKEALRQILMTYSYISNESHSIRQQIYADIEKLGKSQLNQIAVKSFASQVQFIYLMLCEMMWKQAVGVFKQFIKSKLALIQKIRKQVIKVYLCDFGTKEEIKVNKRIVGFVSFKEKFLIELKKTVDNYQNQFKIVCQNLSTAKFDILKIDQVSNLQEVAKFEKKLKYKILDVPISPYLKGIVSQQSKYNLIIEPQGFLFKEDKQTSSFVLRQGSLKFLKSIYQNCNIIFFSKLSLKTLSQYIKYLQKNLQLKFQTVFDKKYLTYKNMKLQKNLSNLGITNINSKTLVIDPYYKNYISKEFWEICFPFEEWDQTWNDPSFIDKLGQKLFQLFSKKENTSNQKSIF